MSSNTAQAPDSSNNSNESPTTPAGGNSPPSPEASSPPRGGENPSPPGSSSSPPPPDDNSSPSSSSSAPPPSSNSPPASPPPQQKSPPNSNPPPPSPPSNSGSSPAGSPPAPASSNSPPSGSEPPNPSPPSNSHSSPPPPHNSSSSSSSPPQPVSPGSPAGSSPPPAPVQSSPPPSETPPSQESTPPPSPPQSLPTPTPSNGNTLPSPGSLVPSPPSQNLSPPLPVSPPVAVSSPDRPTNPTPSIDSPPTSSSTPASKSSNHVPSSSPPSSNTSNKSSGSSGSSGTSYTVGLTVGVMIISLVALVVLVTRRRKRRAAVYAAQYRPPNDFSVKSDGYYYGQHHTTGGSGRTDNFYNSQVPSHSTHGIVNSYGSQMGNMYQPGGPESGALGGTKSWFSYEELMQITNGFSHQNILGEGGFGCVYKGWLPDGRVVAVKQLKAGSGQGEREFRAEVEIISRVHHRHLVSLVGYCIAENQRLLIYEFVPNKTLEHHLHGNGMPVLDWAKRVKIALGAARGLAYLHEDCHPKIIHRDIKSANILLDDAFEAQVADFGLAKLTNDTNTHVSTRVMGTFGYMAPEYASSGKLTDRSDVFSFGVVLLELVTGRKPVDASQPLGDESLVEWARPLLNHGLETGDFGELIDSRLEKHYVESEMFRMIEAAAASVRHSAPKRPRMMQVVRALDNESESDLSNGVKFGQSTIYESGQYNQDINRFQRMAFGSGESSEYDMYSGDYTSKEGSRGPMSSWKSGGNSSEFPSGESETRAMNAHSDYGGHRF